MRLSLFRHAFDNAPVGVDWLWPDFVERMTPHELRPADDVECPRCSGSGCDTCKNTGAVSSKLACPMFSPAFYRPGDTRSNDNVEGLSCWVADLDHVSRQDVERFAEAVARNGWACLMLTTWRHDEDPERWRAVIPLSRDAHPDDWLDVWHAMNHATGGVADRNCTDPARAYFGAYAPEGTEPLHFVFDGVPADPDELPTPPTPPPSPIPATTKHTVSREALERFARMLKRKRNERQAEHGALLLKVTAGKAFAEDGNRDNTIFRLAQTLAERWPDAVPESIAEHFRTSLEAMQTGKDDPDVGLVAYKIARAQEQQQEQRQQAEQAANEARRRMIRDAFGDGREHGYTPEEIDAIPPARWIVQKGRAFYARVLDTYHGPYTQEEAQSALVRDLAPAHTAGIECYTMNRSGEVAPRNLGELVRSYGIVARDIAVDLSASRSYFDERSYTLVEAPCPLRPIEPVYHEEIDAWLDALAGDRAHLLKSWIAAVTMLQRPCTGLFLTGHKHTGKSLLPEGLSRLWTPLGYPTPLEDVLGTNFNDAQLRCPLVFADERLPTDHRGRVLYGELRHYIQARRRPLRRKFLPNSDMLGAVRVIVSANNEEILSTSENLSNHDIGAIVDRWLHVPCQIEAFQLLQELNTESWVDGDMIAAHALWLVENYQWQPNGRFLVHGEDKDLHSRLVSQTGVRSAVLQFCVGYLLHPEKVDNDPRGSYLIRTYQRRLCVNVQAMLACWSHYVTNEPCPTTGKLSRAIAALATEERPRLTVPDKGRPNYRVIDTEHLIAWSEDKDYATAEEIEEALAVDTEDHAKTLTRVI